MDNYDEVSMESLENKYANHTRNQLIIEIRILLTENKCLKSDVARLLDSLTIYKEMPSIEEHMRRVLTNLKNASELSENLVRQSQKDTFRECAQMDVQTKKRYLDTGANNINPKRHMTDVTVKEEYETDPPMENSNDYDSSGCIDQNYWNSYQTVAENSVHFQTMNNNMDETPGSNSVLTSQQNPDQLQQHETVNQFLNVDMQEEQSCRYDSYNHHSVIRKWDDEGDDEEIIFKEGLRTILCDTMEGKQILKVTGIFQEVHRRNLTKIVINYLNRNYAINQKIPIVIFEKAAEEIEKTFPHECKLTYFVSPKKKTKTTPSVGASGKLWAKYYNMKRTAKVPQNEGSISADSQPAENSGSEEVTVGVDEKTAFQYLQGNIEINLKLLECWKQTHQIRKEFIDKQEIEQYFSKIPALKTTRGYQLLLEDFNRLYNDKTFKLYQKWDVISKKIVQLCKFRNLIPKNSPNVNSDLGVVTLLPQLFQPVTTRKVNSITRIKRNNTQETFFLVVCDDAAMQTAVEEKRKEALKNSKSLEPFMTAIVENSKIVSTFVVLENALYQTDSVIHCLDTCFKIFFALNAKYPLECKPVWMFIQNYIYEIETKFDKIYTTVRCAISDIDKVPVL